jgi:hypothetical protein
MTNSIAKCDAWLWFWDWWGLSEPCSNFLDDYVAIASFHTLAEYRNPHRDIGLKSCTNVVKEG